MGRPVVSVDESSFGLCYSSPSCKLYCGRFLNVRIKKKSVDLVVTSPPYNIGSVAERKDGFREKGKYDPKSFGAIRDYPDNLSETEYQTWQKSVLCRCADVIKDSGVIAYNHKPRHKKGQLILPYVWFPLKDLCLHDEVVWNRGSTHQWGRAFLAQISERIYIFKKTPKSKIYFARDNVGGTIDSRTDVWNFLKERSKNKHCAPFPMELPERCILRWCPPKGVVCDPFCGSGTTMLAALGSGRKFIGVELMINHIDQSIKRLKESGLYKECYDKRIQGRKSA